MRYSIVLGASLALGVSALAPGHASDSEPTRTHQLIMAADQAFDDRDCAKVETILAPIIKAPAVVKAEDLSRAYDLSINCAVRNKSFERAREIAARAIASSKSSDYAWRIAIGLDFEAKNYGEGIDLIERMLAAGRGAALNSIPPRWMMRALFVLEGNGDDVNETRLLAILANPAYDPDDVQAQIESIGDYTRVLYARKLLAANRPGEAREMLADIKGYETMAQVAFDPRLNALLEKPVDLRAVAEADLVRHRALLERFPKALSAINEVSFDLRRLGRYDEDVAFLTDAIPQVEQPGSFDDGDDKVPWFWNALGYGYYMTGRYDAMVAAFSKGNKPRADGSPNVDVTINFASYQVDFNRPKDALATLMPLVGASNLSPTGLVQFHRVHGCAQATLGQLDAARADLAYALAHESDSPASVTILQLCVGDEDAAAASYIRRLNDKNITKRQAAIFEVTEFDPPDPRAPKSPFADRTERVRKRPDVVAALRAAVGRTMRIHLQVEP